MYVGYLFNHDSALRTENHVNQKIIRSVKRILNNEQNVLELGNIDIKKEFNFADDIVKAIWLFINQEKINEIILSSGIVNSIKDWVKLCFEECDLNWEEHVIISKSFKSEYNILYGDSNTIRALGWEPSHDIKDLARLMLNKK